MRSRSARAETGWPLPAFASAAAATPAATGLARCQNCVRYGRALPASRPGSSVSPTRATPVPPGFADDSPPCRLPSASARNGCPDRYTARRTRLCARSLPSRLPSPSPSIPPPPVARNRSRWWHRPESRSGRTSVRLETTGAGCRRCATASPATAAAPAVYDAPTFPSAGHQPRSLQRLFHPGVTQLDPMLGLQLLMKVLHVQIEILLPVQREHLLHRRHRHPTTRRLAPSPVQQPVVPLFHVALPPPPHMPVADAQYLRCLPPGNLLGHRLQHHVLYFHCPLHRGPRVRVHACHALSSSPPAKRTSHVLSQPDISCATDSPVSPS